MTSPGVLGFCFVDGAAGERPPPLAWPGGSSLVDQVCLDIGPSAYEVECAFWSDLTGWSLHESSLAEFRHLTRPSHQPFRFLLQRRGEDHDHVRVHLDISSQDRVGEVARHVALGARIQVQTGLFTVLRDPGGATYCVTDRDPATGLLDTRSRPALADDEVSLLRGFLDHHRHTIRLKSAGVTPEQLRTQIPPSDLTLGGMLAHLAYVEDHWFTVMLLGEEDEVPWLEADWTDPDWDWRLVETLSPQQLRALFDQHVARSDTTLVRLLARDGLDQLSVRQSHGGQGGHFSLRWVLLHLIEEYARHIGHADLIRQSLDGSAGA